jgi:thiol-disulfide isomerase/thioredoxin
MNKRFILSILVITVLAGLFVWYWSGRRELAAEREQAVYKNLDILEADGAFNFQQKTIEGKDFEFFKVGGQIVLLNFWASWCGPCILEYPSMLRLVAAYNGKIKMVTVSQDENLEDLERFLKRFGKGTSDVTHLWDPDRVLAKKFGTEKLPETYIFNSKFKLVRKVPNSEDWERQQVKDYLNQLME